MSATCLLLHGAGSCPRTVRDLLGAACPSGTRVEAPLLDGGSEETVEVVRAAVARADDEGRPVVLVGGVSLGAHAAALWASRSGTRAALVLAMPAWTGSPDSVAALTAATADEIDRAGRDHVLARLHDEHPGDWVLEELARGWRARDEVSLVAALRAAATSPAPTVADLGWLRAPVAVVALAGDPLHPEAVARSWAASVPGARLATLAREEPGRRRAALGEAARALLDDPLSGSR